MSESIQKGANMMQHSNPSKRGYILAAVAGALGGAIAITLVTKAIPRLVSQIMTEMMSKMPRLMAEHMKSEGFDPAQMCQQMKSLFSEPDKSLTPQETQSA
jgi:hypothetical protein